MLTEEQIQNNKNKFISLIKSIERENSRIDDLILKLNNSDFFEAPASTKYHYSFKGGLCAHSLNVYNRLNELINLIYKDNNPYTQETIIIVSLLHDFSKMNFYELAEKNIKDENGNWVKMHFYKVKDQSNRFIYSDHGSNSEFMVRNFIPITFEESIAIMHHMGWSDEHIDASTISCLFNNSPLALLLHQADVLATHIDERI